MYKELSGEGKHSEETCSHHQSNVMICMKCPFRTWPEWELQPNPSHGEKRPVPSSGTYITWMTITVQY